jgi:hypothetical protein
MDKQSAIKLIRETFEKSFDKEQFVYFIKNLFNKIEIETGTFKNGYYGQFIPESFKPHIKMYKRIGKYNDGNNRIDVLIVYLEKEKLIERARTMQRNFIAGYLNGKYGTDTVKDAALVAFIFPNEEDWRFSLVKMEYKLTQTRTGRPKGEEEFTPAKRFSFLVGKNEPNHTAQSRLYPLLKDDINNPTLTQLEDAFNIETVTKEFFEKYRDLFIRIKEAVDNIVHKYPDVKEDFTDKGVDTVDFAKKLMGQIIFLYFLQKKGWFGVEKGKDWGTGSKRFLRDLYEGKIIQYKNFFNDVLEPLFYDALARDHSDIDHYNEHFKTKIPFLNGGLFDPINNYDWVNTDILLSDELFSNNKKTKQGDIGDGILDIFDRYNFTVKEDEPLEKEVAIDPELLGKAYEKFNAIRPDNFDEYKKALRSGQKGAESKFNKQYGVYYTPREIVHYMCQQSLINYLVTGMEGKVSKEATEFLILNGEKYIEYLKTAKEKKDEGKKSERYKETEYFIELKKHATDINSFLSDIKVCDPAIGSGAFSVGMMTEIIKARLFFLETKCLSDSYKNLKGDEVKRNVYNYKRDCIQNSLYGVDIDPGAVEIAKLRLWLSLVVDEEDIKRIRPLPNLDYKIICGNSLLGVEKDLFNANLFNKLEELKPLYFNETNASKKKEYKNQIDDLISQITNGRKDFDFEVYFSEVFHEKKGFDVVIANPPYVRQEKIKDQKQALQKQGYEVYNSTSDLYTYFYERSHQILKPNGFSCFISSNKWMRAKYGEKLRRLFKEKTALKQIIDFNGYQVFDATVDTDILLFQKTKPSGNIVNILNIQQDFTPSTDIANYFNSHKLEMKQSDFDSNCFTFGDETILNLKKKIEEKGIPLKNWDVKIYRGIITGFNEAFIIDVQTKEHLCKEDPKSAEIIKPILRGRDIYRYGYKWAGLWVIKIESRWTNQNRSKKAPEVFFRESYPAVHRHLKIFGNTKGKGKGLYNRDDQGDYWWELRDCDYYPEFEKEKIAYSDIANRLLFVYEGQKIYTNNTVYFLNTGNKYLLAALNSIVTDFYYRQISSQLGNAALRAFTIYVEQLPIPKISESDQKPFVEIVNKILALTKSDGYLENSSKQAKVKEYEHQINQMVYKLYGLTKEEIKIVEGSK